MVKVETQVTIYEDDTVVVLDDDPSIHGAWNIRFRKYENIYYLIKNRIQP